MFARARTAMEGRYGYSILLALVASSAVYTVSTPESDAWHLGNVLIQAAIALAAVGAAAARREVRIVVGVIALIAVATALLSLVSARDSTRDFALLGAALAALVPAIVGRGLLRTLSSDGATGRVIAGALSVYLLLGMFCAYVYAAIAELGSGPLFADGQGDATTAEHVYFSFITQTTVGYGDYVPLEPVARAVAMSQALAGQLYLVTVVALLVGGFLGARTRGAGGD